MKKDYKKYWLMGGIVVGVMVLMSLVFYQKQPAWVVQNYIKAINERDFEKAYTLIYKDHLINDSNKKAIMDYMEKYFGRPEFVGLKSSTIKGKKYVTSDTNEERMYYQVKYLFTKEIIDNGLSLVHTKGNWQVIFPFKITDVTVYAPTGTEVFFDEKPLTRGQDDTYLVNNVLPGEHVVRMVFPNAIYSDYITTIQVPATKQVIAPYETVQVTVEAPKNTIIELAGEKKVNAEGTLVFDHILEGTYNLKIIDPYGQFEQEEEIIEINKESKKFYMNDLKLSEEGKARIQKYIEGFYKKYEEGIINKDTSFWKHYGDSSTRDEMIATYHKWFIEGKEVQEATVHYEIEGIEILEEGGFNIKILEVVNLNNKELAGPQKERNYQVILTTSIKLRPVGESFIVEDKGIEESMVSYEDASGKWIAY